MSVADDWRRMKEAVAQQQAQQQAQQWAADQTRRQASRGDIDAQAEYDALHGDLVNSPPHYKQGDVECIDAIESALTAEEFRGYCKGNALKYIWRERHKGQDESLKKAVWYLERALKA